MMQAHEELWLDFDGASTGVATVRRRFGRLATAEVAAGAWRRCIAVALVAAEGLLGHFFSSFIASK